MPKGRTNVPSITDDGNWYKWRGWTAQPLQREHTTAGGQMNDIYRPQTTPKYPPTPFREKERTIYKYSNRFSKHDNRHSFQEHGVYFGHSLGKKLEKGDRCQHNSDNHIYWQIESGRPKPFCSTSASTYLGRPTQDAPTYRRFPRKHPEPDGGLPKLNTSTTSWFREPDVPHKTPLHVMCLAQEPFLKHNPWHYSNRGYII